MTPPPPTSTIPDLDPYTPDRADARIDALERERRRAEQVRDRVLVALVLALLSACGGAIVEILHHTRQIEAVEAVADRARADATAALDAARAVRRDLDQDIAVRRALERVELRDGD